MKATDYIASKINRLTRGYVFTYEDFMDEVDSKEAVVKALNRMAAAGKIAKLAKGKYYKPEATPFGTLLPPQEQVVKDMLEENGKIVGYLTGYSIYNQLGLTTQVGSIIQIGKNETRASFKRERYTIAFIRQKNTITKENIPLLQILDAMRYIKKIPDTTVQASIKRLSAIVKGLTNDEQSSLARLALKYPPSTRALLGALLEQLQNETPTDKLRKTLNPITKYSLPGALKALPNAQNWNIE
ncbi:DUF6088 family protein [Sunxiuqinia rutila]|uniref:DUF6088 family protein n=1 Tax=Sunxiuqinia rutila TaxID=1397841 RepID=UPI003D35BFE4